MKTKIIPFDLELAKKIQAGEIKGRIVTEDRKNVRVVCFDLKHPKCPIIAAVTYDDGTDESNITYEVVHYYDQNGYFCNIEQHHLNLSIELLEETLKPTTLGDYYDGKKDQKPEFKPFDKVLVRDTDKGY